MMFDYVQREVAAIEEKITESSTRSEVLEKLRRLGLSDFGFLLLTMPNPQFPKLSRILPRMASDEVQKNWTGTAGVPLLIQSTDFVRSLSYNYTKFTGESLEGKKVLDYGCGYGRIARLMYYFTREDDFHGVDPWDESLKICNEDGLVKNFHLTDYLPDALPFEEGKFDLIFAFSVFTHLSERATRTNLDTLSRYVQPSGLIAITIRPVEYWDADQQASKRNLVEQQKSRHETAGFAFLPHNRPPIDGDVTYGDTSMTLDWIRASFPDLEILGIDRSLSDPYQIYVFLKRIR